MISPLEQAYMKGDFTHDQFVCKSTPNFASLFFPLSFDVILLLHFRSSTFFLVFFPHPSTTTNSLRTTSSLRPNKIKNKAKLLTESTRFLGRASLCNARLERMLQPSNTLLRRLSLYKFRINCSWIHLLPPPPFSVQTRR